MYPHTIVPALAQERRQLAAMMDAMQQCLCDHLPPTRFQIADLFDLSDFVPLLGMRRGQKLLKLPPRIVADAKQLIHGSRRQVIQIRHRQIENRMRKEQLS